PRRERVGILHVVVKDGNLVPLELLEAGKRAQRVEIIVENRNLHACVPRVDALARAPDWARDLTHSRSRIEPATAAAQVAVRRRKPGGSSASSRGGRASRTCDAGTVPNRSYLTACPGGFDGPPAAGASRGNRE